MGRRSNLYHPFKVGGAVRRCPDNVRFLNYVEDIVDAHCGCDVFFTPSFAENQGVALMESMAVGRPVVARDLPGLRRTAPEREERPPGELCRRLREPHLSAWRRMRGLSESLTREGRKALEPPRHQDGGEAARLHLRLPFAIPLR